MKQIRDITSEKMVDVIVSRVLRKDQGAEHYFIDARKQAGMTKELAMKEINQILKKDPNIRQVRIAGDGFDVTERAPGALLRKD